MANHPDETIEILGDGLVIDTAVLLDWLVSNRPQHSDAVRMARILEVERPTVLVPAHAFFELTSALACEARVRNDPSNLGELGKQLPFEFVVVPITLQFVDDYLISGLNAGTFVDLTGGDMIFVVLAEKHGLKLITRDKKMAAAAAKIGVVVQTPSEFNEAHAKSERPAT